MKQLRGDLLRVKFENILSCFIRQFVMLIKFLALKQKQIIASVLSFVMIVSISQISLFTAFAEGEEQLSAIQESETTAVTDTNSTGKYFELESDKNIESFKQSINKKVEFTKEYDLTKIKGYDTYRKTQYELMDINPYVTCSYADNSFGIKSTIKYVIGCIDKDGNFIKDISISKTHPSGNPDPLPPDYDTILRPLHYTSIKSDPQKIDLPEATAKIRYTVIFSAAGFGTMGNIIYGLSLTQKNKYCTYYDGYVCRQDPNLLEGMIIEGLGTDITINQLSKDNIKRRFARITGDVKRLNGTFRFNFPQLFEVTIPKSVTSINAAFTNCSDLWYVKGTDNVTEITESAFENCVNLEYVPNVPKIQKVGGKAFKNCKLIKDIDILSNASSIEESAFMGCTSLKKVSGFNKVPELPLNTFADCTSLEQVSGFKNLTYIGSRAFYGCSALTEVPRFENLIAFKNFGYKAGVTFDVFNGCPKLPSIYIGNSLTKIDINTLNGFSGIIEYNGSRNDFQKIEGREYINQEKLIYLKEKEMSLSWKEALSNIIINKDYSVNENTYTIKTAKGLAWFANEVNTGANLFEGKTVVLENDIDLNCDLVKGYEGEITDTNSWSAIGTEKNPFMGTFNGNAHTVSNVKINNKETSGGLFGQAHENAVIENVGVMSTEIYSGTSIGGIVGNNKGIVRNCYNKSNMKVESKTDATSYIGGVVGYNSGTVKNCYNLSNVISSLGSDNCTVYAGGVVGYNAGTLNTCYSSGDTVSIISNTENTNTYIGGVSGFNSNTIKNCYYKDTSANMGIGNTSIDENTSSQKLTDEQMKDKSFVTILNKGVTSQKDTSVPYWKYVPNDYPQFSDNFPILSWNDIMKTAKEGIDYSNNNNIYTINTAKGLAWFVNEVNTGANSFKNKTVALSNNINLDCGLVDGYDDFSTVIEQNSWAAIGTNRNPFRGTFDGRGYTVSGIKINTNSNYGGLFGKVMQGGTVKNVGVVSFETNAVSNIGAVVAVNNGYVMNCYNTSNIISENNSDTVGGIVGSNYGLVQNCYNTGSVAVNGDSSTAGGIIGNNKGIVENCYNTGNISANGVSNKIGAVIGQMNDPFEYPIENCYYRINCALFGNGDYEKVPDIYAIKMDEEFMKSQAFVDTLNNWMTNQNDSELYAWVLTKDGYPTLFPVEGTVSDPVITQGANSVWVLGTKDGLSFSLNCNMEYFVNVCVDGKIIDSSNYIISKNSITLTPAFLETLSVGEHSIEINFEYGSAKTTFTILKKVDNVNPETGDNLPIIPLVMFTFSLISITIFIYNKKGLNSK